MKERFKKWLENPKFRKTAGIFLIVIGLFALLTPFTPGSWLALIGLEFLGFRLLFWERIKAWLRL